MGHTNEESDRSLVLLVGHTRATSSTLHHPRANSGDSQPSQEWGLSIMHFIKSQVKNIKQRRNLWSQKLKKLPCNVSYEIIIPIILWSRISISFRLCFSIWPFSRWEGFEMVIFKCTDHKAINYTLSRGVDDDSAPMEHSWSVGMGRASTYIPVLKCGCIGATCCPCSLDQLIANGAKSSSNIFCPIL